MNGCKVMKMLSLNECNKKKKSKERKLFEKNKLFDVEHS